MPKKIKNQWAVYTFGLCADGFGKITEEGKSSVYIEYSEGQTPKAWDSKFVERFSTLEKAVEYYIKNKTSGGYLDHEMPRSEVWEIAQRNFPSYFNKKK